MNTKLLVKLETIFDEVIVIVQCNVCCLLMASSHWDVNTKVRNSNMKLHFMVMQCFFVLSFTEAWVAEKYEEWKSCGQWLQPCIQSFWS